MIHLLKACLKNLAKYSIDADYDEHRAADRRVTRAEVHAGAAGAPTKHYRKEWLVDQEEQRRLQKLGEDLDKHVWNNKAEILASEQCLCTDCGAWFGPNDIKKWWEERHAVCPQCSYTGVVLGSASGLSLSTYERYALEAIKARE